LHVAEELRQKSPGVSKAKESWEWLVMPLVDMRLEGGIREESSGIPPGSLQVWNRLSIVEYHGTPVAFEMDEVYLTDCY
jgi:hypothetical protein